MNSFSSYRWSSASHKGAFWTGLVFVPRKFMTSCWAVGRENRSSDWTSKTFRKSCMPWAKPHRSTWTSLANAGALLQAWGQHNPGETKRPLTLLRHCKITYTSGMDLSACNTIFFQYTRIKSTKYLKKTFTFSLHVQYIVYRILQS